MRLTLRHRALLEIMSRDNLIWDDKAGVYRNGTDRKQAYEPDLFDDLCAVGLADTSQLPTDAGYEALKGNWPSWLPDIRAIHEK